MTIKRRGYFLVGALCVCKMFFIYTEGETGGVVGTRVYQEGS